MQSPWLKPLEPQISPGYARRAEELRCIIRELMPEVVAIRTCSEYRSDVSGGKFLFSFFSQEIIGEFPALTFKSKSGNQLADFQQLLLLYYFALSDGVALTNKLVSFADLPGGRLYAQAFQGYSGDEIVKTFGINLGAFKKACEDANGQPLLLADAAFVFQVLPMISVAFVYWLGDDDFPSSCKILFDAAVTHFVPIDACAIIGSMLVHKITQNS